MLAYIAYMDPTGHITPYHYITRIDIHFNGFDSGFLSRPAFHLRPMMCLATQWSERPTMWRLTRRGELVEVHGWGVCMWEFVHLTGHQNDKKLLNMAIYSWFMLIFPLIAWWFSIGFLYVYQRVEWRYNGDRGETMGYTVLEISGEFTSGLSTRIMSA